MVMVSDGTVTWTWSEGTRRWWLAIDGAMTTATIYRQEQHYLLEWGFVDATGEAEHERLFTYFAGAVAFVKHHADAIKAGEAVPW